MHGFSIITFKIFQKYYSIKRPLNEFHKIPQNNNKQQKTIPYFIISKK